MKKFLDDGFKPYLFPVILAFLTVFFRESLDFKPITKFFSSSSTSNFLNFFSAELYVWQIIISGSIIYLSLKVFNRIFNSKTKEERKKLNAIKNYPPIFNVTTEKNEKIQIKFKLKVLDDDYTFEKFIPYCQNCDPEFRRMSRHGYTEFRCNCGTFINHILTRDIKSAIITSVEKYESN